MIRFRTVLTAFLVIIFAMVIVQAFTTKDAEEYKPKPDQPCVGEPLQVNYPYYGGSNDPHECQVQCDDQIQRYLVYTNGKATQCQILPGCLDWGEDQGVTCDPPES